MEIIKLTINIIITLFYCINFLLLEKHFILNLCSYKKTNQIMIIYWFDYTFILLIISIITLFRLIDSFDIDISIFSIIRKQIIIFYPLICTNQFILNIILSIQFLFKLKKVKNKQISNFMNDIYNKIYHFIKHSIILIIEGSLIFYLEFVFSDDILIFFIISIFQVSLIFISVIMSFIVSKKYKYFLNYHKSFDSHNITEQKKYENNKKKVNMVVEHYFYKNICDFILSIPCILFHSNSKFIKNINDDNINYDLYYYLNSFFGFLYLYIFGIMLLNIDYFNKDYIEKILNLLFCSKKYNFYFGNGKNTKNIKDLYNKNFITDKLNYNSYFKDESENNILIKNEIDSFSENTFNDESSSSDDSSEEKKKNEDDNKKDALKYEYSPCNFYFIYKLLYLYFKINKNIFLELEKNEDINISKIENLNSSIIKNENIENSQLMSSIYSSHSDEEKKLKRKKKYNSVYQKKSKGKASNVNIRDYSVSNIKEKLDNISRISITNKKKLIISKKYTLDELTMNLEDQKMKKYFIKHIYKNLNHYNENDNNISNTFSTIKEKDESLFNSSSEVDNLNKTRSKKSNKNDSSVIDKEIIFSIKSLTSDTLFDINPYYNLKIKDIIKSLDISSNNELFSKFSEEKLKNESYNYYYTKDSLLCIEIYDEQFLNSKEIKSFIRDYKNYLLDKFTNFSYSFLPLIIGIFNIKYLSYSKIVVLSRNPLTFTYNINFHYWLKFIYFENDYQIETSIVKEHLINLDEIEISNNILLENNEYKNSVEILDNDLLFLQNSLKFNMNFKLNLFILNDEYKNDLFDVGQSILSPDNHNLNDINNNALDKIMRDSLISFQCEDYIYKKYNFHKKYFGSDDICLLEKLYVNELDNNRYIFKIYFSDIFKKKIIDNNDNKKKNNLTTKHNNNDLNSSESSSFLLNKEDEDEKENIISKNNSKYCEILKSKLIRNVNRETINTFDKLN